MIAVTDNYIMRTVRPSSLGEGQNKRTRDNAVLAGPIMQIIAGWRVTTGLEDGGPGELVNRAKFC